MLKTGLIIILKRPISKASEGNNDDEALITELSDVTLFLEKYFQGLATSWCSAFINFRC